MEGERPDEEDAGEDTEGQALTWKVRKPIPEAHEDEVEGHAVRPPPELVNPGMPGVEDDDEVEGHGGMTGNPRPPVH
jgi:hypothetical protein